MFSIWIPQLAAFVAALVVAWLAKRGLNVDQTAVTAFFVGTFALVKGILSRYWNPGNVAAPELVDEPQRQVRAIRRARGLD